MGLNTPVLFIVFNRIDTASKVFERIRQARPNKLFIAADGPRQNLDEKKACWEARSIAEKVDWPCELKTYFLNTNKGPRVFLGEAISWFFNQVDEGIILEHDCLPHPDFFPFCEKMLAHFREEEKIMHISGIQFQDYEKSRSEVLYSHYNHIWGWATWKRAWKYYDSEMKDFPKFLKTHKIKNIFPTQQEQNYWVNKLSNAFQGEIKSWDYQWTFAIWNRNALAVLPGSNLVSNIGFDSGALHTKDESHFLANRDTYPINCNKIIFPKKIEANRNSELFDFKFVYFPSFFRRLRNWVASKL